jgi:hypothetical protein
MTDRPPGPLQRACSRRERERAKPITKASTTMIHPCQ